MQAAVIYNLLMHIYIICCWLSLLVLITDFRCINYDIGLEQLDYKRESILTNKKSSTNYNFQNWIDISLEFSYIEHWDRRWTSVYYSIYGPLAPCWLYYYVCFLDGWEWSSVWTWKFNVPPYASARIQEHKYNRIIYLSPCVQIFYIDSSLFHALTLIHAQIKITTKTACNVPYMFYI